LGYDITKLEEIKHLALQSSLGVISSLWSEDAANHAKNSKLVKAKQRFRAPQRCMAAILAKKVTDSIHRYDPVVVDSGIPERCVRLGQDAFIASESTCSLEHVAEIASTKQKTPWYSTGAVDLGVLHADLESFREAKRRNSQLPMEEEWLGRLCSWKHHLVMRRRTDHAGPWYFPLHSWSHTSVLCWPAKCHTFNGYHDKFYFLPSDEVIEPTFLSVWDVDEWVACAYNWRSPLWQMVNVPLSWSSVYPCCRAVAEKLPCSLLKLASDHGFWRLEKSYLTLICKRFKCALPAGASLLQTLLTMVMHFSKLTIDKAFDVIRFRLADGDESLRFCAELAQLDDVDDCLDRFDKQAFAKQQEKAETQVDDHNNFKSEFFARVEDIRKEADKAGPKKKKPPKGKTFKNGGVSKLPDLRGLEQIHAREWIPKNTSIWRDNVDGGWETHCPPFRRRTFSFCKHGVDEALRLALQDLWRKHLLLHGIAQSECPLHGVFDTEALLDELDDK
jgi:hypothetical protein